MSLDGTFAGSFQVSGGGSSISLETNGTPNSSQTTLNLEAGSNITLTNTSGGNVSIAASGGGGGTLLGANISGTGQVISSSTPTTLTLGTVNRDDGGFTGTANTLTVPAGQAGWYVITMFFSTSSAAGSQFTRTINPVITGSGAQGGTGSSQSNWGVYSYTCSSLAYLPAGATVTLQYEQFSGSNETLGTCSLSLSQVSPS